VEALVVALGSGPVDHNVIKVDGHIWDPIFVGNVKFAKRQSIAGAKVRG